MVSNEKYYYRTICSSSTLNNSVYYSVFTNDNTIKQETGNIDETLINKFVPAIGMLYVTGKCSIEIRQLNNTFQVTIGLWNILKSKS